MPRTIRSTSTLNKKDTVPLALKHEPEYVMKVQEVEPDTAERMAGKDFSLRGRAEPFSIPSSFFPPALFKRSAIYGCAATLTRQQKAQIDREVERMFGSLDPEPETRKRKSDPKDDLASSLQKLKKNYSSNEALDKILADLDDVDGVLYPGMVRKNEDEETDQETEGEDEVVVCDDAPLMPTRTRSGAKSSTATTTGQRQRQPVPEPEVVDISDEEEDAVEEEASFNNVENGTQDAAAGNPDSGGAEKLLSITVCLKGTNYRILMYDNKLVGDLRREIGHRSENQPEHIQMFFAENSLDYNNKTLKEVGMTPVSSIDAFVQKKSNEDLFKAGGGHIMRFKLQTDDRRGRETCYMFIRKDDKMRVLRDQFAGKLGIHPSTVSLRFDGDMLNLDETPENCDLGGEECLDVVVSK